MSKPFDTILKQLLDNYAADWVQWLGPRLNLPPGPIVAIDPQLATIQPMADKVFRLPDGAGLLHIECQSSWDGELSERMLVYNVLLESNYGEPVESVAILLRPEANIRTATGLLIRMRRSGEVKLQFAYDVVRIWEQAADELISGAIGTAPLGLLTNDARNRLPALVRELSRRAENELADVEKQNELLIGSFILLGLRYDRSEIEPLFVGIQHMRESSTYQGIFQDGEARGEARGKAQGEARGTICELRLNLITLLEQRFGSVPPELEKRVQQSEDMTRLRVAFRKAIAIDSIDQFEL